MKQTFTYLFLALILGSCSNNTQPDYTVHTFYYNWYGNPEHDSTYLHWAHQVLPHWSDTTWNHVPGFPGGENIGANYYPALGCYSCSDTTLVRTHIQMIRQAGIGTLAITWWGKGSFEDSTIPLYLQEAEREHLKIVLHIEPFYNSAEEFRSQLQYIVTAYANHSAFYRKNGKPFYYVYDSYRLPKEEWARLLQPTGDLSVRSTPLDATFIGLWVHENEQAFFLESGFDGFYTYFASDGFVYGSTTSNWQFMAKWAEENGKLFIPCVGPGYKDTRIRPWNNANTKPRECGAYFKRMWDSAVATSAPIIGITSFNEWHEGTQIEPATEKTISDFTYDDYEGLSPDFYLQSVKRWIDFRSTSQDK